MNRTHFFATLLLASAPLVQAQDVALLKSPAAPEQILFSRDGSFALAACTDERLRVWRLPTQDAVVNIDVRGRHLVGATLSDNGSWIAAADRNGTYTVWNAHTGARQWEVKRESYAAAMAFDRAGKRLAMASVNEPVELVDAASGQPIRELPRVQGGVQQIAFSPDGSRIATAGSDTAVHIYETGTGREIGQYTGFLMEPLAVAFSTDGRQVLAGGGDQYLAIIDSSTGTLVRRSARLSDPIGSIQVAPDGKSAILRLIHAVNMSEHVPFKVIDIMTATELRDWQPSADTLGGYWSSDAHLFAGHGTQQGIRVSQAW